MLSCWLYADPGPHRALMGAGLRAMGWLGGGRRPTRSYTSAVVVSRFVTERQESADTLPTIEPGRGLT